MGLCRRVGNNCPNRRPPSEVVSLSLSLDQRLAYIKNAAIKPSSGDLPVTSGPGRTRDINSSTSVVDGNLIAFEHGVFKEQKTAVEQSSLYAQFVANAKYNRVTQTPDWYREYLGALAVGGWVGQASKYIMQISSGIYLRLTGLQLVQPSQGRRQRQRRPRYSFPH
ncbi:hypothetical protein BKA83DRAFT_683426 [Pisolithus microcarpus]|nr:hypothetical protein BKA83DRAFT_683426 [Pisolithus microcarpus]